MFKIIFNYLAWCKETKTAANGREVIIDTICVGYRSEYGLVKLDTSAGAEPGSFELCELFPTGKNQDCSVTLTADNRFALGKDDQTTFVDLSGTTALESLTWSGTPKSIANDPPYLISTLSDFVEIRTETPKMVIQTIDLQKGYIEFTLRIFMPQINLAF